MPFQNLGELKTTIANWLDRDDLENQVPDFIELAANDIFRDLRCPGNEQWVTYGTDDFDNALSIEIPNDFQAVKNITYGGQVLERKSDQWYLTAIDARPAAGTPKYFARIKDTIYFFPPADSNEAVQLVYWEDQVMVDDTDQSRTLRFAPGLYLYGALLQAQSYLIGDERIPVWQIKYDSIMSGILMQSEEAELAGSTVTVGNIYADRTGIR